MAGGSTSTNVTAATLVERADDPRAARSVAAADLRAACARDELELHYQPIYRLPHRTLVAFEALLRWRHPSSGILLPGAFLPVAERAGLMPSIERWVFEQAAGQLAEWRAQADRDVEMTVNVSPQRLAEPDFVADLEAVVTTHGLGAGGLCIEITENARVDGRIARDGVIDRIRESGVRVALDDFGSGYASLTYLRRFRIDLIKADRTLVDGVDGDAGAAAIVAAVVELGRVLGIPVVAEGIETPEQLAALERLGCAYAQGFLLARPMPARLAGDLLATAAHAPEPE